MSAGAFTTVACTDFAVPTRVYRIRVQPETTGLSVNVLGTATVNQSGLAIEAVNQTSFMRVSGSRRSRGIKAASIRFRFVDASAVPGNYLQGSLLTLPVLNPAILGAGEGATGTYLGQAIIVAGTSSQGGR